MGEMPGQCNIVLAPKNLVCGSLSSEARHVSCYAASEYE